MRRIWRVAKRRRERFRAHRSYNINDPVCTRARPVESWIPDQPPSRPIYISVLFKHDCYSISTQLVNALLFNRVACRRAGLVGATRRPDVRRAQRVCETGMRHGNKMSVNDLCNLRQFVVCDDTNY